MVAGLQNITTSPPGNIIMFVGNTGVGKSSLVNLLAGNTANFKAVEDSPDTGSYHIVETTGIHVSNITTESKTTYPEPITDLQSGVVFFDMPGFRDTRSAVHEVIAAYGLQFVAKTSKAIKIALLVNYESLTIGGSRDDFINTLKSFFSLLNNPSKYRLSTHLVATKVRNDYIPRKGKLVSIPDNKYIESIKNFLDSVRRSQEEHHDGVTGYSDKQFLSLSQTFIRDFVDGEKKIHLFKKPDQEGPVMDSEPVSRSLETIRESLVKSNSYVSVGVNDFGYTLTDKAKNHIRELFDMMNNYTMDVGRSFTQSFQPYLVSIYKNYSDISDITADLQKTKTDAGVLIHSANMSHHPNEFADALQKFLHDLGADFCSNETLQEMKQLNKSLSSLKGITGEHFYVPDKWTAYLYDIERIVKNEQDYYAMLHNLYNKLTEHDALTVDFYVSISSVLKKHNKRNKVVDKNNYGHLMEYLGLKQYASLKINQDQLDEINAVYTKAKNQFYYQKHSCKDNTSLILGSFLQLQTLDRNKLCADATTVVLLATNRIYIDTSLGVDVLGGRNLVIIAPEWYVMGKFVISVDGPSQGAATHKAPNGQVGVDGKPGQSAGKFVGVGLHYYNSEQLTITANGGNGQNGQDGGDGQDGLDGYDNTGVRNSDKESLKTFFYNKYNETTIIGSDKGSNGGNAGMGGFGGARGLNGSIDIHNLSPQMPHHSTHVMLNGTEGQRGANGIIGRGGKGGCDQKIQESEKNILILFKYNSVKESGFVDCNRENPNGQLVPNNATRSIETPSAVPNPPSICNLYTKMADHFEPDIFSNKLIEEFQQKFIERFGCKVI
ncbi:uncharacterized protein LOC111046353 isoform X3 [Nilaparvata lugens]|nr:uncharacterized protein LOC111046353 isoform X3 [Nilaparvata lugens]